MYYWSNIILVQLPSATYPTFCSNKTARCHRTTVHQSMHVRRTYASCSQTTRSRCPPRLRIRPSAYPIGCCVCPRAYVSLQIAMTCKRVRTVMYSPPDRYVALTDSPDWLIPSCTTMEHKPSCHNNHKRPQSMNYGLARAKQKDCRLALAGAAQLVDFCYMLPRIWMHIYHHHSVMST